MKKVIALLVGLVFSCSGAIASHYYSSSHPVHVRAYVKKSGKFVSGYYRARPHHRSHF